VASALEAWARLQHPAGPPGGYSSLAAEIALVVALPLIALAAGLVLSWLVRRLTGGRTALGAGGHAAALQLPLPEPPSAAPPDQGARNGRPTEQRDRPQLDLDD
jgi:hypothetical protein